MKKHICVIALLLLTIISVLFVCISCIDPNELFFDYETIGDIQTPTEKAGQFDDVSLSNSTTSVFETTKTPETPTTLENTKISETTNVPDTTSTPETTGIPETTSAPETTIAPETTKTPETTSVPETTRTPETTKAPETTKLPETTSSPETTTIPETTKTPESTNNDDNRIVYWVAEGYVWHYNPECWTLDKTADFLIYSGYATDAKAIGKERACKVCADGSTIDIPETTVESEVTSKPDETQSPSTDDGFTIVSWPATASRNEVVSVTIYGKANTKYYIEVYYKSGPSTSKDLSPKVSDSHGEVIWTWKVGAKSSAGTFDIIVKDEDGKSVKVEWTVVVD